MDLSKQKNLLQQTSNKSTALIREFAISSNPTPAGFLRKPAGSKSQIMEFI